MRNGRKYRTAKTTTVRKRLQVTRIKLHLKEMTVRVRVALPLLIFLETLSGLLRNPW
jgi:hypothetical protein